MTYLFFEILADLVIHLELVLNLLELLVLEIAIFDLLLGGRGRGVEEVEE